MSSSPSQTSAEDETPAAMPAQDAAVAAAPKTESPTAASADVEAQEEPAASSPAAEEPAQPPATAPATVAATPAGTDSRDRSGKRGTPRVPVDQVQVGARFMGKVVGLSKFGAFVDIGAMTDGLVHMTELPGKRVRSADQALQNGQEVEVWVKEVDAAKNRISLTMKTKPANPMDGLKPGAVLMGRVTSIATYGAFVDVQSDSEGLVHVSEMSSGYVKNPLDILKVGAEVEVRVKEVDPGRNRISLSMVGLSTDPGKDEAEARAAASATASANRSAGRASRDAERSSEQAELATAGQPEEKVPSAMELAMERLLSGQPKSGKAARAEEAKPAKKTKVPPAEVQSVYSRMLEEYRESKDGE